MSKLKDNIITQQFKDKKPLITYICGGDPNLALTEKLIPCLAEAGSDLIEVGIPFSDPLADGPVIQAAAQRALQSGTTLKKLLISLEKLSDKIDVPLILMGYYNSILNFGEERFARAARKAGIAGVIIPDLPVDAAAKLPVYLAEEEISQIRLVTPNTSRQRLQQIASQSEGFLYCVALLGTTGANDQIYPELKGYLDRVRQAAGKLPLGLGFGIDGPEKVKKIIDYPDGIIIGSALIETIQTGRDEAEMLAKAAEFIESIKAAMPAAAVK